MIPANLKSHTGKIGKYSMINIDLHTLNYKNTLLEDFLDDCLEENKTNSDLYCIDFRNLDECTLEGLRPFVKFARNIKSSKNKKVTLLDRTGKAKNLLNQYRESRELFNYINNLKEL